MGQTTSTPVLILNTWFVYVGVGVMLQSARGRAGDCLSMPIHRVHAALSARRAALA